MKRAINIFLFLNCLSVTTFSQSDSISDPKVNKVISVVQNVEDNNRFLDQFDPDSNAVLPIGMIKKIGATRYVIAIDTVKFKPNGAYFNAYAAIDFPGSNKKLAFEATNIKFNPKGVVGGSQSRLMLVSEHVIRIDSTVSLKLKADGNNFVEWDCNGFKAISIKGSFIFSNWKILPDSTKTLEKEVSATFQIYTSDIHNFVTQVSITPFTVQGLKNWNFEVTDATVDMSELMNAPGMSFPAGYSNPNMIVPQMWTGFYLKSLKVKLPPEISKAGKRTEVLVNNLLIDRMGLSGLFQVNNVFGTNEGSMSGWAFSVDELGIGFVANQLNSGHLKGKLNIPVIDSATSIGYEANVYYNPLDKETDYGFIINPANGVRLNVFSAVVDLENTSKVSIVRSKGILKPTAVLNGLISFDHSKFNSNGGQLKFQSLTIITQAPYLTNGIFTLHTAGNQIRAAKYPVSVNDITFGLHEGSPVLGFSVTMNMMDKPNSGFGAGTQVSLKGKITENKITYNGDNPTTVTRTNWKFEKVVINGISFDIQTAPFTLKGGILFKDDDPVYGDAFFGALRFSIKKVMQDTVSVKVCFGSKDTYRYCFVDAAIPTSIPLGTQITLTKLMGGMYYHMKPNASQAQLISASQNQPANPGSALTYVPDEKINLGFRAGVGFKYTPSAKAANGDVMLEVAFTNSGGLDFVKLTGDAYVMVEPIERYKAPVKGSIEVEYDCENKVFDANLAVIINAYGAVTGNGPAKIHIEPGAWYTSVGRPSSPLQMNIINYVTAEAYFMIGNKIEPALAPPPEVSNIISQAGLQANRNEPQLASGSGFCGGARYGASINKQFGFDFFTVYGGFGYGLGFDMMLMNYGSSATCSGTNDKVGMNGWQAGGSMYIFLQGKVGVKGNIVFPKGCDCEKKSCFCSDFDITIFDASAAAMVNGKLPKPIYFNGQLACNYNILGKIKGNFDFEFEFGKDCNPVSN